MRGCGLALAGLLLLPLTATAHHSVAANFDARIVTELQGEITHMSNPPEDPTPVLLGISAGRWEGDALIVTTNRISWRYFDTVGIPLSEDAVVVEEFALTEDGGRLDYTVTVTNPGYFTEPVVLSKFFRWVPGVEVGRYDCTVAEGGSTTA